MPKTPKLAYAVAPLHNVSLPKAHDVLSVGQYRIVRVKPEAHSEDAVPGEVLAAMNGHALLADWTNVLNEGYVTLKDNTPKYIAYFFMMPGEFTKWLGRTRDFSDVKEIFVAFQCALSLHNKAYLSFQGGLVKGVSLDMGAIAEISAGRSDFDRTPNVPMMDNPKYLDADEVIHRVTRRDVGRLEELIVQVRRAQKTRVRTAIDRLVSSADRSQVDRLVDLLVVLEVLFGDEDRAALAHKIAFRCSTVVGRYGKERQSLFRLVKQAYDKRSRVLHGQAGDLVWLDENLDDVDDVVRRALTWAVQFCHTNESAPEGKDVDMLAFKATPAQM